MCPYVVQVPAKYIAGVSICHPQRYVSRIARTPSLGKPGQGLHWPMVCSAIQSVYMATRRVVGISNLMLVLQLWPSLIRDKMCRVGR